MDKKEIIKVLLVDDEKPVRAALKELLNRNFPDALVVGEAGSVPEAVREIHQHSPDLIFLDIEMPGYSGLQLLEFFNPQQINFDIIFVTAFNEYAIQAFKIAAFDYLLKPVNSQELQETLSRYNTHIHKEKLKERVNLLKESYTHDEVVSQLAISSVNGIDFVQLNSVLYFEASGTYTNIIQKNEDVIVSSKPLGEFEAILVKNKNFFRPHRSYLINLQQVKKLSNKEGDFIIMNNTVQIPLSRYRKKDFESLIVTYRI